MYKFSLLRALGFGEIIWALMAGALWILASIEPNGSVWSHLAVALVGGVFAYFFARVTDIENNSQALSYAFAWTFIVVVFDLFVTQWFDKHVFVSWQYWLGVALVFMAPWFGMERKGITEMAATEIA